MPQTTAIAHDAAISYFGLALSDNIARTSEGYVICKDAVIGRTGKYQYLASTLHTGQLKDLNLDTKYRPNEVVDVWRDPDEVFAPATLASFEGKPITDNHPDEFVTAENHSEHHRGHVQNVRAGTAPLSSGDLPVLADLVITDPDLGDQVIQRRRRELSGGYNYHLAYDGTRLFQVGITGNHVAVVPKGRAGAEARINDAAAPRKDYPVMTKDFLIGLGLSTLAKDADPEKMVAAARAGFATDSVDKTKDPILEAKDAEIATLRGELKKAEDALKAKDEKKDDDEDDEKKKEKAEDAECAKKMAELEDADDDDETEEEKEKRKKAEAEDANFIQPIGESTSVDVRAVLKELRPIVARSKDAALQAKFNKLASKANDGLRGGTPVNAYGTFSQAAGTKSAKANDAMADYSARLNARAQARSRGEEVK